MRKLIVLIALITSVYSFGQRQIETNKFVFKGNNITNFADTIYHPGDTIIIMWAVGDPDTIIFSTVAELNDLTDVILTAPDGWDILMLDDNSMKWKNYSRVAFYDSLKADEYASPSVYTPFLRDTTNGIISPATSNDIVTFNNIYPHKLKSKKSPLYITLYGDSNTKMYESTTLSYDGGYGGWESYAAWLNYFAANRPYMYDATIDKKGRIGARTYNAIPDFDDSVNVASNVIVLSFGTNDVRTPDSTLSAYISRMNTLLDSVDGRDALPVVLGIPFNSDTTQSLIISYNNALDSLCQSRGVKYVDTYYLLLGDTVTYFTEPSGNEKIHYSDKAAKLVAEALVKALDEIFGFDGSGNKTYYKENWSDENPIIFYNNAMIDKYLDDTCFYSGYYEDSIISRLCWNGFRLETGDSIQFRTDGKFCFGFYALDGDTIYLEWKVSQRWRDNNDTIYTYLDTVTSGILFNGNGTDKEQDWKLHRVSHGASNIYNDVTLKVTGDNIYVRTFSTDRAVWKGGSFADIKMTGSIKVGAFTALGYVASTSFRLANGGNATMTGTNNIAFGSQSLYSTTSGSNNIAVGFQAGYGNTVGKQNVYMGYGACYNNDDSDDNTGIGYYSLRYLNAAAGVGGNTAVGAFAGVGNDGTTTGLRNTFVGSYAGTAFTTADRSVIIGYGAGFKTTTGDYNTMIGYQSGYNNVSGASNVFLGYQAGLNETGSNKLYIENSNSATPLIYGDFSANTLTVNGTLINPKGTIADNDSTPSVAGGNVWQYNGTANAVEIDALDDHQVGAFYTIIGNSGTYTITVNHGTVVGGDSFSLAATTAWVGGQSDVLVLYCIAADQFIEVTRSDN